MDVGLLRKYSPRHSHWFVCPVSFAVCLCVLFGTRSLFERYAEQPPPEPAHDFLSVSPKSRKIRVACVGDSISVVGSNWSMNYPAQLQRILGDAFEVHNFGYSSMTMMKEGLCWDNHSEYATKCSYWDTETFRYALECKPDIVTIMLGTNDGKHYNFDTEPADWNEPLCPGCPVQGHGYSFEADYLEMFNTFKTVANSPRILIAVPPPIFPPFYWNFSSHVINEVYPGPNGLIRKIAKSAHADGVVDVWAALGGNNLTQRQELYGGHCGSPTETCTMDGIHPNDAALTRIAHAFAASIRELLPPSTHSKSV